ncbi:c-type cytochrome [Moraxella marmotae]|uniref:c-type cytochrome n=1 Tax=Moraxella marmotae TaxID=3344520 RepID=UPI0035D462BD
MMTMKKAVMFSVAALLAVSTMATQAQESANTAAEATTAETAAEASTDAAAAPAADATASESEAAAPAQEVPQDSPQVQKLVAMYPNLIARIAPYGKVCFDGEECDINITVLAPAVEGQARDGESLYKAICSTCHDAGLVGAPKFGTSDWAPRIGKGKETLYDHAIHGFNAMPARGGSDISDDEVKNAVDYIVEHSG